MCVQPVMRPPVLRDHFLAGQKGWSLKTGSTVSSSDGKLMLFGTHILNWIDYFLLL